MQNKLLHLLSLCVVALLALLAPGASAQLIVNVVETGGDNEATDTITAKWTGQTFPVTVNNEPVNGLLVGQNYTVPAFGEHVPSYLDRNHRYTNAPGGSVLPGYLLGREYIIIGQDNRDNNPGFRLDVTVSAPVQVYLLVDNRLGDPNSSNADPPSFGPTRMQWVLDEGWTPVCTAVNRVGNTSAPDEVGVDEGSDGTINQYYSVYTKHYPAGTFQLKQPDNAGQNMYGVVVAPPPSLFKNFTHIGDGATGSVTDNLGGSVTMVGGGNDIWDAQDAFDFNYTYATGDFDVAVRVESLEFTSTWTKAGIMARESLSHNSRMGFMRVTPQAGANDRNFAYRTGLEDVGGANGGAHEDGSVGADYPNAWIRLQRVGSVLNAYSSADGLTWDFRTSQDTATWQGGAYPATIALGLAVSRHSGGDPLATAEFRNLSFSQLSIAPLFAESAAAPVNNPFQFDLVYSRPVKKDTAENLANYSLPGVTLNSASLQADGRTVRFTSSSLRSQSCNTLTINNVRDAENNLIAANSTVGVLYADGAFRYRQYNDIGGGAVTDLTSNPAFPNSPSRDITVTKIENPGGGAGEGRDNYGAFLNGLLTAPTTGAYKFYISADDGAALFLSTDENPANKVQIAREPIWSSFRNYNGAADGGGRVCPGVDCNQSAEITLQGGCRYYIELIYKEGGGGDFGSAAWKRPGDSLPADGTEPIGAQYLSLTSDRLAPITMDPTTPADRFVPEGEPVTFTVTITGGSPAPNLQWYRNGVAIPGATGSSYTIPATVAADNGSTFRVVAVNAVGTATSREAFLAVGIDDVAPRLVSAAAPIGNPNEFDAVFSEPVNQADAEDISNYSLPGVTLMTATLQADNRTVRFTSSSLADFSCKTLTATGIRDRAPLMNSGTSSIGVRYATGNILVNRFDGIGGVAVNDLLNNPAFPNSPTVVDRTQTSMEYAPAGLDNYGARLMGFLSPAVSGPHTFYIYADDGAALWLSTDEDPANKVRIANEPVWAAQRQWTGQASGGGRVCPSSTACNISAPINLQAGCRYYIEMIYKEGGGGDFGGVTWQTPAGGPQPGVPANGSPAIPGAYLSTFDLPATITSDIADATIQCGTRVTFSPTILGAPPLSIQWYKDGNAIPGANSSSYTTDPLNNSDNGAQYWVIATTTDPAGTAESFHATVTVTPDNVPPTLLSVSGGPTFDTITLVFSENVDPGSAGDTASYTVGGGSIGVNTATVQPDGRTVVLTTTPQAPNTDYTVNVNSQLLDFCGNPIADVTVTFHTWVVACGGLVWESYNTGGGTTVNLLTGHPNFPNNPDGRRIMSPFDTAAPGNLGTEDFRNDYGARMRGVFVPSVSGNYIFYVHSDDSSQLFINPSGPDPAGKVLIAEETGCCRAWPTVASGPIALTAGTASYIEALYKEGGGGDYIRVAARLQGSADPLVAIPLSQLGNVTPAGAAGTLAVSSMPDQTVPENSIATFSVTATPQYNYHNVCYQWQRDGVDIPGANGPSYSFGPVEIADEGAVFCVVVSIPGAIETRCATLHVTPDTTPPTCVSIVANVDLRTITVRFSEFMDPASATDTAYYTVTGPSGPLNIQSITMLPDGMSVSILLDAPFPTGVTLTVAVNGVSDASAAMNILDPPCMSQVQTPVVSCGFVKVELYFNVPGGDINTINDLTASPRFPDQPDASYYTNIFLVPQSNPDRNNFGIRITGVFIPRVSGPHTFYVINDDAAEVRLSTDANPANKTTILARPCCNGAYNDGAASAPIDLVAGTPYYIEGIAKEVGGGDYLGVAVRQPGDLTPTGALPSIPGTLLGNITSPEGVTLTINDQPDSTKRCLSPSSGDPQTLKSDDFNSGDGGLTVASPDGPFSAPWTYNAGAGSWQVIQDGAEVGHAMTTTLTTPAASISQAGNVRLTFVHRWSMEQGNWDGGAVQVSVNGGPYVTVPNSSFTSGGYNGTVLANSASVLRGQMAFVLDSAGHQTPSFITSVAELGYMSPGDTVSIRFLYAGDTNTRGNFVPNWEITSMACTEGISAQQPVTFSVSASASNPSGPAPIFYQWQRNCGNGWVEIAGANSSSYSFSPLLSDNGCCYRVELCTPGAVETSDEACLTVVQPNTPPSFTGCTDVTVPEDSGAQSVPGFLTDIQPDSLPSVTGSFSADFAGTATMVPFNGSDFSGPAPGAQTYINAYIGGGILHLTDAANSQGGAFYTPVDPNPVSSYTISYKEYVGGGTCCGATTADGYSINIASDLPLPPTYGNPAEEGAGSGLSVLFDTWDNGGGEAPAINLRWAGAIIASAPIDVGQDGAPVSFRNVSIAVTAAGEATVVYNGSTVFNAVVLPGWAPQSNLRVGFGARTGGANDNHWIDDLVISGINGVGSVPPPAPAGSAIYGNAYLGDGVLHLTDAINGQSGAFVVNDLLGGAPLGSFTMNFNALVGDGTAPPADGMAVSIANNLPAGPWPLAEEGEGNGLTVSFDNFDNGGGEAPAIDVKWQGTTIAHTVVPSLETGMPAQFVPVAIKLDPDGTLDVTAAGIPVYVDLATGYSPIIGAKFGIGARTGGLNAKHWVDDLQISATSVNAGDAEANQTVTFIVSNDNPALFSVQPAISSDGTLTYTPAANACGMATVTVVAMDDGGVDPDCGGRDTSQPCDFKITVTPVNDCPVGTPQSVSVPEGGSVAIVLTGTDADANGCGSAISGFTIASGPANGTLSGTPPNVTYTPNPGFPGGCGHNNGADSFTFTVTDGECTSAPATVNIQVVDVNQCPTARADASLLCDVPNGPQGIQLVISHNGSNACIIFDGRLSSDPECDTLTYAWFADGSPVPFATGPVATNCFPVGPHTFKLVVDDGTCMGMATIVVEIITACDAIDALIDDINTSNIERRNKRPFIASLKAACASFERGNLNSARGQLGAFKNKVRSQIERDNPVEAARFCAQAQAILDAIECAEVVHGHGNGNGNGGGNGNNGGGNGQDPPPPGWQNPGNPHVDDPPRDP